MEQFDNSVRWDKIEESASRDSHLINGGNEDRKWRLRKIKQLVWEKKNPLWREYNSLLVCSDFELVSSKMMGCNLDDKVQSTIITIDRKDNTWDCNNYMHMDNKLWCSNLNHWLQLFQFCTSTFKVTTHFRGVKSSSHLLFIDYPCSFYLSSYSWLWLMLSIAVCCSNTAKL